jgi:hypothetical protein
MAAALRTGIDDATSGLRRRQEVGRLCAAVDLEQSAHQLGGIAKVRRPVGKAGLWRKVHERVDRVVRGHAGEPADVVRRPAEAGAAEQMRCEPWVPRPGIRKQRGCGVERPGGTV